MPRRLTAADAVAGCPEVERMLRAVAHGFGARRHHLWYDDLLQAARIRLWREAPRKVPSLWTGIAWQAMASELRRVTDARTQGCTIPGAIDWALLTGSQTDTPESWLQAAQTLQALRAALPGWPDALAESDNLADAGARMGVSESRACQRRGELSQAALTR